MQRGVHYVLANLMWIGAACVMACAVPAAVAPPAVVLEATSTMHGVGGYEEKSLLLRLTEDGKIEWDEWIAPNRLERKTDSVGNDVVSKIQDTLNRVDRKTFRARMGPYYTYVDTSVELEIRMNAKAGPLKFFLVNPWYGDPVPRKAMPTDVRTVFCEVDSLYAEKTGVAVDRGCKTKDPSH
jgi:hypothetical protein